MNFNPRHFVHKWFQTKGIKINERGKLEDTLGQLDMQIIRSLVLDYREMLAHHNQIADKGQKAKGESPEMLTAAVEEMVDKEMYRRRMEIAKSLTYSPDAPAGLVEAFVKLLTGKTDPTTVVVLKHWLWQIKRKLNNRDVVFHIMPIIVGLQGAGKSKSIEKLTSPLKNLVLDTELSYVLDTEKSAFALSQNFVAILDEMAGARKANVEALKRKISASHVDARAFFTQKFVKVPQNVSFIGTSNSPVGEILYDPTGMRRFYQIDALPKLDWDAVNAIDYVSLFKSIDENREQGYIREKAVEVASKQKDLVGQDEIGAFLEYFNINVSAPKTKPISSTDLYDKFRTWCESNGVHKYPNVVWFSRRLTGLGIAVQSQKRGKKTIKYYLVDEDSGVHDRMFDPLARKEVPDA